MASGRDDRRQLEPGGAMRRYRRYRLAITLICATLFLPSAWAGTSPPPLDSFSQERTTGHPLQRYFLYPPRQVGPVSPEGLPLILILPGGHGDERYRGLVTGIVRFSLPHDTVVAQPIAFKWTEEQRLVWPTTYVRPEGMGFKTNDFIAAVIADVREQFPIDPKRVFLMGFSSSGGAVTEAAITLDAVSGAFIQASVFKPRYLPDLAGADGKRFFLFHSPTDKVVPIEHSIRARRLLTENGGYVVLETYAGGHTGHWPDDRYWVMRRAALWLEGGPLLPRTAGDESTTQ